MLTKVGKLTLAGVVVICGFETIITGIEVSKGSSSSESSYSSSAVELLLGNWVRGNLVFSIILKGSDVNSEISSDFDNSNGSGFSSDKGTTVVVEEAIGLAGFNPGGISNGSGPLVYLLRSKMPG